MQNSDQIIPILKEQIGNTCVTIDDISKKLE